MRKRKKTGVHGTLEMIPLAWKLNSKQLLCKTLNSRMKLEPFQISSKRQKISSGGQTGGPRNHPKILNFRQN